MSIRSKWTCDVCRIAKFDSYEEADKHERSCKGVQPPPPPPPPTQSDAVVRKQTKKHHSYNYADKNDDSSSTCHNIVGNTALNRNDDRMKNHRNFKDRRPSSASASASASALSSSGVRTMSRTKNNDRGRGSAGGRTFDNPPPPQEEQSKNKLNNTSILIQEEGQQRQPTALSSSKATLAHQEEEQNEEKQSPSSSTWSGISSSSSAHPHQSHEPRNRNNKKRQHLHLTHHHQQGGKKKNARNHGGQNRNYRRGGQEEEKNNKNNNRIGGGQSSKTTASSSLFTTRKNNSNSLASSSSNKNKMLSKNHLLLPSSSSRAGAPPPPPHCRTPHDDIATTSMYPNLPHQPKHHPHQYHQHPAPSPRHSSPHPQIIPPSLVPHHPARSPIRRHDGLSPPPPGHLIRHQNLPPPPRPQQQSNKHNNNNDKTKESKSEHEQQELHSQEVSCQEEEQSFVERSHQMVQMHQQEHLPLPPRHYPNKKEQQKYIQQLQHIHQHSSFHPNQDHILPHPPQGPLHDRGAIMVSHPQAPLTSGIVHHHYNKNLVGVSLINHSYHPHHHHHPAPSGHGGAALTPAPPQEYHQQPHQQFAPHVLGGPPYHPSWAPGGGGGGGGKINPPIVLDDHYHHDPHTTTASNQNSSTPTTTKKKRSTSSISSSADRQQNALILRKKKIKEEGEKKQERHKEDSHPQEVVDLREADQDYYEETTSCTNKSDNKNKRKESHTYNRRSTNSSSSSSSSSPTLLPQRKQLSMKSCSSSKLVGQQEQQQHNQELLVPLKRREEKKKNGDEEDSSTKPPSSNNGIVMKTKQVFLCDVCRSAYFETYEEAEEHEKHCRGVPPPPDANINSIHQNDVIILASGHDIHKNNTISMTRSSTTSTSYTDTTTIMKDDFLLPPQQGGGGGRRASPRHQKMGQERRGKTSSTSTSTYDDLDDQDHHHPKIAEEEEEEEEYNTPTSNDLAVSIASNGEGKTQEEEESSNKKEIIGGQLDVRANDTTTTTNHEHDTVHEIVVNDDGNNDDVKQQSTASSKNAEIVTLDHLITAEISPLLHDDADSQDFFKLSSFHAQLLSSIDLFEFQMPLISKAGGEQEVVVGTEKQQHQKAAQEQELIVSFRCTHCREMLLVGAPHNSFSNFHWTRQPVKEKLCTVIFEHLHSICEEIPVQEMQRLSVSLPYKDRGKISFSDFIEKYFDENGIVDDIKTNSSAKNNNFQGGDGNNDILNEKNAKKASKMVLLKPPEWVTPNYSCRRRTEALGISMLNNDQTISYKIFPMSGVKGMEKNEKTLTPMNRLVIKQLTFLVEESKKTVINRKSYYHVAIRCKHCGSSTYLKTLRNWYKFVYTMTYSHLAKSCQSTPINLRKELLSHQGKKNRSSKTTGLKQFCDFLANHFGFVEKESSFGYRVCVPCIPDICENVASSPLTIIKNKRKHHGDVSESSLPLQGNKNKKDEVQNSKKVGNATNKKLKTTANSTTSSDKKDNITQEELYEDDPQAVLMAKNALKEGIMVKGVDDGCTTYLLPPTGVPLLCSFTTKMASELNRHNRSLIDQFELVEDHTTSTTSATATKEARAGAPRLLLRCQHCSSNPKRAFTEPLTSCDSLHKTLVKCRSHLENCLDAPKAVRTEISRTKTSNNIGYKSLKDYCQLLSNVYGMVDTKVVLECGSSSPAVAWGANCKYTVMDGVWGPRTLVEIDS